MGAANLGAGTLQGFPVSSSASRTALAASAGARSQVYSLSAGVAVLAVPTSTRAEFRADAVALARSPGRAVSRVAAELGVNHETLRQ